MIHGIVNQSCEAILPVVLKNDTKTQLVDAVIDTGFSGFLTLPSSVITALELVWKGRDVATLGCSYCEAMICEFRQWKVAVSQLSYWNSSG
jgi:predicted aspartyl protease